MAQNLVCFSCGGHHHHSQCNGDAIQGMKKAIQKMDPHGQQRRQKNAVQYQRWMEKQNIKKEPAPMLYLLKGEVSRLEDFFVEFDNSLQDLFPFTLNQEAMEETKRVLEESIKKISLELDNRRSVCASVKGYQNEITNEESELLGFRAEALSQLQTSCSDQAYAMNIQVRDILEFISHRSKTDRRMEIFYNQVQDYLSGIPLPLGTFERRKGLLEKDMINLSEYQAKIINRFPTKSRSSDKKVMTGRSDSIKRRHCSTNKMNLET